jgi:hypothetical protein
MSEPGTAVAQFAFASGELRGTQLALYPSCLVHRGENHVETLPLAAMSAVSIAFQRDARKLGWGIALGVGALLLLAVAAPLGTFASKGAQPAQEGQVLAQFLYLFYSLLEALASLFPVAALACVLGSAALCTLGWLGTTTLAVSLPGAARVYVVRGRDTLLLDFAETLGERLASGR